MTTGYSKWGLELFEDGKREHIVPWDEVLDMMECALVNYAPNSEVAERVQLACDRVRDHMVHITA